MKSIVIDTPKTRAVFVLLDAAWCNTDIASALGLPYARIDEIIEARDRGLILSEQEAALRLEAATVLRGRGWSDERIDDATHVVVRGMSGRFPRRRKDAAHAAIVELRSAGWTLEKISDALLVSRQTASAALRADARREEREL